METPFPYGIRKTTFQSGVVLAVATDDRSIRKTSRRPRGSMANAGVSDNIGDRHPVRGRAMTTGSRLRTDNRSTPLDYDRTVPIPAVRLRCHSPAGRTVILPRPPSHLQHR